MIYCKQHISIVLIVVSAIIYPLNAEDKNFQSFNALDLQAEYLEDSGRILKIDDFVKNPNLPFTKFNKNVHSGGYTESQYWVRLQLPTNPEKERLLVLHKPIAKSAELFRIHQGKIVQNDRIGMEYGKRTGQSLQYYFTIPPTKEVQTVYIRYRYTNAMVIGPELFLKEKYPEFLIQNQYLWGLFFGMLLIMGIYNLFIFISLRDINYLYYFFVLLNISMFQFITRGFTPFWITAENIAATDKYVIFFASSTSISTMLFLFSFIEMPTRQPVVAVFGKILILFFIVIIFIALYNPYVLLYRIMTTAIEIAILYGFFSASRGYLLGYKPAIYFIIATFFMLLGTITYILALQGIIPYNWFTGHAQAFGSSLEVMLFSLALAERIRINRKESAENLQKALQLQKEMAVSLEAQVEARTRDLHQANATKDKFFSLIAHDLRGPIGSLSVLFNDHIDSSEDIDEKLLKDIRHTTYYTYDLLNNLLCWARNQKGELKFNPINVSIYEVIEHSLAPLMQSAIQNNISLLTECHTDIYVFGDQGMVATIIRNLVSNAIRFTPARGKITVSAVKQNDKILVGVSDTGTGISQEKLVKLFHLDEQMNASITKGGSRTSGLGLVLCREFVEKHNGEIRVESMSGKGTTFWFTLPIGKKPEQATDTIVAKLRNLKILVVEDTPLHQQTTFRILEDLELEFLIATNGEEAIELAGKFLPDLVLMDINLPGINGTDATKKIRENKNPPSWIVALTSYSQAELKSKWHDIHFDGYLSKPLEKSELLNLSSVLITKA